MFWSPYVNAIDLQKYHSEDRAALAYATQSLISKLLLFAGYIRQEFDFDLDEMTREFMVINLQDLNRG